MHLCTVQTLRADQEPLRDDPYRDGRAWTWLAERPRRPEAVYAAHVVGWDRMTAAEQELARLALDELWSAEEAEQLVAWLRRHREVGATVEPVELPLSLWHHVAAGDGWPARWEVSVGLLRSVEWCPTPAESWWTEPLPAGAAGSPEVEVSGVALHYHSDWWEDRQDAAEDRASWGSSRAI